MPQPRGDLAATFQHKGVARSYRSRPPYPSQAIDLLVGLVVGTPARVLDLGAGEGSLARPLAGRVAEVDAVELSAAMVRVGRAQPGGDVANLHWHIEPAEEFTSIGPFGLAVAGASMHWFDLDLVCRRLATVLHPGAPLAVCDRIATHRDLAPLTEVIRRYSRAPEHDPSYSVSADLEQRGLWQILGTHTTSPLPFRQSIEDYLDALHSTSSLARELMSIGEISAFDDDVNRIIGPLAGSGGLLDLRLTSTVTWGRLAAGAHPVLGRTPTSDLTSADG